MKTIFINFEGQSSFKDQVDVVISKNEIVCLQRGLKSLSFDREFVLSEFSKVKEAIRNSDFSELLNGMQPALSRSVFIPLGQWLTTIKYAIENNYITKEDSVIIQKSGKKINISMMEAEGESQTNFLYDYSFFLAPIVIQYLRLNGVNSITTKETSIFNSIKFYIRGLSFIHLKFFQQCIYKIFYWFHSRKCDTSQSEILFTTRGLIQSQFIKNIQQVFFHKKTAIFAVESSIFPFRNYRYLHWSKVDFSYGEGILPVYQIISDYIQIVKKFLSISLLAAPTKCKFFGLSLNLNKCLADIAIYEYYCSTLGKALKHELKNNDKRKTIVCFDMLSPQPYYVKCLNPNQRVVQIQTTLMASLKQENYVFGDKFYFSDRETYNNHSIINHELVHVLDVLPDIKYSVIHDIEKIKNEKRIIYFTQPIFQEDEGVIIQLLKEYSESSELDFMIKLHPRSRKAEYSTHNVPFVHDNADSIETIKMAEVVATRNSSIGYDAWKLDVPVLFFVNGKLKNTGIDYIPDEYQGTFKYLPSIQQISNFVDNKQLYFHDYGRFKISEEERQALKEKVQNQF
ncbi:hypothetical protein [Nonlabens xiamenensis]|uniref:hypothetical protein n=1 Tax=Nonlabens xiamenensis TaxID=2341043 RepID=UPI000F60E917|nr:hypothetical protein [Nonlabens xiamenensis]